MKFVLIIQEMNTIIKITSYDFITTLFYALKKAMTPAIIIVCVTAFLF